MTERPSPLRRAFRALFRGVDLAGRLLSTFLLLLILILLVALLIPASKPSVKEPTALVVAPSGVLVEELFGYPAERALLELLGQRQQPETLLRTILEALEKAREDDRVEVLALDLNRLAGAGLSKLQDLKEALEAFRASGKKVIAFSDFYLQPQYYLASQADEVYLHPMGLVLLQGYGSYRRYYREALDRLEVSWNVFRVGEYKSAVEPFLRNDMSEEAREARQDYLGDLWRAYKADVAAARGLEPQSLEAYSLEYNRKLALHGGDMAQLALAEGLVDHVAPRDAVEKRLIELVGEDEESGSYNQIDHETYLRAVGRPERKGDSSVAVVVARGEILDGTHPPGVVGGDSTAALLRRAREDEKVKALVLRVDSPGGSSFASEIIRREVELAREEGKPVVVSMGSVAASGGYWISMTADQIWASPTTITGSIGIYAMIPTFERTLRKLGVHNDGTGTGPLAGTLRPDRELPEEAVEVMQLIIEQGYREFVTKAAEGRGLTVEQVQSMAEGRVWSGEDGFRLGLVDHLGGIDEAIAAAAELASLGEEYQVRYVRQEPGFRQQLLSRLFVRWAGWREGMLRGAARALSPESWLEALVRQEGARTSRLDDPRGILAYCFCEPN